MDVEVCLFSLSQRTASLLSMELYKGFSIHFDAYGPIFHVCSEYMKNNYCKGYHIQISP